MSVPLRIVLALLCAGSVAFLYLTVLSSVIRQRAGKIAIAQAQMREEQAKFKKLTFGERARQWAALRGFTGAGNTVLAAGGVLYTGTITALSFLGVPPVYALLAGLPATGGVAWTILNIVGSNRKKAFDRQLLIVLNMLAGLVESGVGPQRALEQVAAAIPDPMHSELSAALEVANTTRNLVGALRGLYDKFPSRAFELFITAIEIDQDLGGRIEPALRQAAEMMQRDFDVAEEAKAELSQAKSEFGGMLIILAFICFSVLKGGSPESREAYTQPFGMIAVGAGMANVAFGIMRANNLMRRASGTTQDKKTKKRVESAGANEQETLR